MYVDIIVTSDLLCICYRPIRAELFLQEKRKIQLKKHTKKQLIVLTNIYLY